MKRLVPHLVLVFALGLAACGKEPRQVATALSVSRLQGAPHREPALVQEIEGTDGVKLAYRAYLPEQPVASLIFYHGGGAHSGASYQHIAAELAEHWGVAVFTPDIRGHGASGGKRGDTPSTEQIYRDVASMMDRVKSQYAHLPLFLGGHSSGAGLILNYESSGAKDESSHAASGFVFVAPQLGFRSKTEREPRLSEFAEVTVSYFVLNSMSLGLICSHCYAVEFHYAPEVLERDPLLVTQNSVSMANALTPTSPGEQLAQLSKTMGMWLAADDQLIDPKKVTAFVKVNGGKEQPVVLKDEAHLSILLGAADKVGPWITERVR